MRNQRTAMQMALVLGTIAAGAVGCGGQRRAPEIDRGSQVAIGYDRVDEKDVTGAVSSLSAEDFELIGVSRVEELIRDRLPGVQVRLLPNGDYSFRIRGTRSLVGNNEPLVVIDGIPVSQQAMRAALSGLAPRQILRIDVLKDAGSTAAYGSRGANGVIMITTRNFQY